MTSPKKRKAGAPSLSQRVEALAKNTKFGEDGLRILAIPISRDEFDFKGITPEEGQKILLYEYAREVEIRYSRDAFSIYGSSARWGFGDSYHKFLSEYFPLPFQTIKRDYPAILEHPFMRMNNPDPSLPYSGIISEMGDYWYGRCSSHEIALDCSVPPHVHYLRIAVNAGKSEMKKVFSQWVDDNIQSQQKRRGSVIVEDKLNALAAWRAHRAGLHREEFCELKPLVPYADASAYRTAWKRAEKDLISLVKK
jgi:hypothetical protein